MIENEKEVWKSHPDIPGIEVSSFGRVRTLDRVVSSENGTRFIKGRVLKQSDNGNGYLYVNIPIDGKQAKKYVHRLVARTYLPNPGNLPEVNHKSCIRDDNHVSNLEFCTRSYNRQYREKYGISLGSPVFAINLDTNEVSHFRAQREAGRKLGINQCDVNAVLKGRQKTAGGYWFVNDDKNADYAIKCKLQEIKKIYN